MNRIYSIIIFIGLFYFGSCGETSVNQNEVVEVLHSFDQLQSLMEQDSSGTWVVNFWATTCPPCLKEMPHFAELEKQYTDSNVKVLLVSLDEEKYLDSRVMPFIEKHKITPEVILLADQNYSAWTDEIDPSWFGALPATLIKNGDDRNFRFGAYDKYDELIDDLNKVSIRTE